MVKIKNRLSSSRRWFVF